MARPGVVAAHRLAIDIGGTFTDLAAVDEATGRLVLAKADTTPGRLEDGVTDALDRSGVDPAGLSSFVHGTTVVINAITERAGASTALVTTRGFRDVLEIGRANRPDLYNLRYRKPLSFVPRRRRFEVTERVSYRGDVITPLQEEELDDVAAQLRAARVEAVAVCFLHAWANPDHERRAAELLAKLAPHVEVVASHQVSAQWREFERSSTAVLSAYVKPVVSAYLAALRDRLQERGVRATLRAMRSSGGVCSFERATSAPIVLLESGPVAGVTAAAELGRRLDVADVLTLDIGGTTAKTSAVRDGRVRVETIHYVERTARSAGYPIQTPVVEIVEIGAGGGSIARVDEAGGLHVGPVSAGAEPGPACYGRGGTSATITDANLVAGRLDPDYFLGGAMRLEPELARDALARLGASLGAGADEAARGVLRFAVAQMAHALRLVTVRRGHDPRDFTFVAYGGAGPLHASLLARELGVARTIIPPAPGNFSAFGMLQGDLRADSVRTHVGPLEPAALSALFDRLERDAAQELEDEPGEHRVDRFAQLRYVGQEHTIEMPLGDGPITDGLLRRLREGFDAASEEVYAFRLAVPVEIVAGRVATSVPGSLVDWGTVPDGEARDREPRQVDLDQHGGVRTAAVVERAAIEPDRQIAGPCIVEEPASTTLVLPEQTVRVDGLGNLVIEERR